MSFYLERIASTEKKKVQSKETLLGTGVKKKIYWYKGRTYLAVSATDSIEFCACRILPAIMFALKTPGVLVGTNFRLEIGQSRRLWPPSFVDVKCTKT